MALNIEPREVEAHAHTSNELAKIVPRIEVSQHALAERQPTAFPVDFVLLLNFFCSSVWHWNSWTMNLERLRKLVEHLFVVIESHLTVHELVQVRFQLWCIVTELLGER